jgi:hypothetical protein
MIGGFVLAALCVLEALATLRCGLLLAVDAGRFIVLPAAGFGQDTGLLNEFVEPLQRLVEALVTANVDFRQTGSLLGSRNGRR